MDSKRYFVRVKWVDFEGDIYFSNRIRPIQINLSFSMGWAVGEIVLTNPTRVLQEGLVRRSSVFRVAMLQNFLLAAIFLARKP